MIKKGESEFFHVAEFVHHAKIYYIVKEILNLKTIFCVNFNLRISLHG